MTLTGYQIKEKIYEGRNSLVYRGQREVEPRSVVLKMLREEYPSPKKLAAFRREYRLLSVLQLPGVIRAYELITDQHRPVMVLEDFGGESLAQLLQNGHLPFATCLPLAIQIVDIVGQVHQQQIIHKDINPANFVLNRQTGQLKLIDFGIAAQLSRENPSFQSPTGLEGTLAYISPEQTGRMNRLVDYRTDFYSLGITLYELLTGRVPFLGTDALTLVHAHIAQQPTPPHEVVPEIPPPLSLIVMKLLAKNAEDRYQSAASLRSDLAACLRQWEMTKTITLFPVGQYEITQRLQIPQKLYGREQDCSILYDAFTRVSQGASELLLISGPAGIGKTTLVQEVYKALIHQRGYFIAGKFDQLQRSIPYGSLVQAFRALIRQILTESEERVTAWRNALLTTVGVNLQVVIDVIPEVELLVGPQPSAPPLPPAETQSRFRLTFQSFFRVFLSSDHPLVLFLDDLQWADSSSLSLLQLFLTVPENRYLFVICAYRDNEVPAGHRVQVTLDEIRKEGGAVSQIILGPLSLSATQQLISDTLHSPLATVRSLAELVVAKTAGNPFFINEFLKSLDRVGLLTFAVEERQWQWNVVQIRARNITDNVVELMSDRMQDLGGETQATLELAACLGNQFDLQTLATVSEKSPLESAAALWPALSEGLILPLDETYRLVEFYDTGLPEGGVVEYKFAHDRIQQAAYALIPETQKQAIHQRIGQLLLQQIPPEGREQQIFTIVNQLNAARGRIQQPTEQNELVTLNLQAGRKAKAAAAYGPAFTYLQVGLSLLTTETWQQHYELALALHVEAAEVSYLCGDFEQMEHLIDSVCRHAQTLLDTVKAYEVRLAAYSVQNRQQEGIQTGLQILKLLQIQLPEKPGYEEIFQELGETQRVMAETPVEYLRDLPVMTDPHRVAAIRILFNLTHHVYTSAPELFPFIVFRIVTLSARYGNTRYSAFGYATYGLILCGQVGDIDRGYQFGQLAQRLVEQEERKAEKSSTLFVVNSFIRHWKEHIRETLKPLLEAYQTGLETGDLSIGTQAAFVYGFQSYWMGKELGTLEQELEQYSVAVAHMKQELMLNLNRLYQQAVANLMGRSEHPCRLVGSYYDEERMRSVLSA
ncbi:MAG: AAA family ATPase, partial [Candidatus Binatia bacterium]